MEIKIHLLQDIQNKLFNARGEEDEDSIVIYYECKELSKNIFIVA